MEEACNLLDFAAADDVVRFEDAVHSHGASPYVAALWYHRPYGVHRMGLYAVTPTMLASLYGSLNVLKFILSYTARHVRTANTTSGVDNATPLHYAVAGCSPCVLDTVKLLLSYGADADAVDAHGMRPLDVVNSLSNQVFEQRMAIEKLIWQSYTGSRPTAYFQKLADVVCGLHASSTDAKSRIYTSDDFRMFSFKVRQCSRAYCHDWTECPFVHTGENARRRDPRKFHYSCLPCPHFRKLGACRLGDACEYAHGIFESWLHPAQYRTRLCKDGKECKRRVCFFAHAGEELRPLQMSSGCAVPSPRGPCAYGISSARQDQTSPRGPYAYGMTAPQDQSTLCMSSINPVDLAFCDASPPAPSSLPEHMPSLLSPDPLLGHNGTSSFENMLLKISLPPHSRQSKAQDCRMLAVVHNLQPKLLSRSDGESPRAVYRSVREMPNAYGGSKKPSSCPPTSNSCYGQGFSISDWGSPTGKLEWAVHKEDLRRLRTLSLKGSDMVITEQPVFGAADNKHFMWSNDEGYNGQTIHDSPD